VSTHFVDALVEGASCQLGPHVGGVCQGMTYVLYVAFDGVQRLEEGSCVLGSLTTDGTRGRYSGIVPRHTVFRSKLSETKIGYSLTLN
jgi:hypothetical protein